MNPSYDNSFGSLNPGGANPSNIPVEQPTVSGQGDIILTPQPTKKSKKWWILSIVLGVFLVTIITIVIILFSSKQDSSVSFKGFVEFIESGTGFQFPEEADNGQADDTAEIEGDSSESAIQEYQYIFAIQISQYNQDLISAYYKELDQKSEQIIKELTEKLSSDQIMEYQSYLSVLRNAINFESTNKLIFDYYNQHQNLVDTEQFINNQLNCPIKDSVLSPLCRNEHNYFEASFKEYTIFKDADCYNGNLYSYTCAAQYYGDEELTALLEDAGYPSDYLAKFQSESSRKYLDALVRIKNSEILKELASE